MSVAATLDALLLEECAALRQFAQILEQEQQLLVKGDVGQLLQLAQEKTDQTETLTRIAERRREMLAADGHALDRAGMARWLQDKPLSAAAWAEVLKLAALAQEFNRTNGILINDRLQRNQQALAILQAAAGRAELYGPDGQPMLSADGRRLGSV